MVPGDEEGGLEKTQSFRRPAPGSTISHYKIVEKIGEGGMAVVYKAEDTKLNRHVALKLLPPELTRDKEARERFVREARAASALDHPNICIIHEIDETEDGQLFISMAYYDGETLKEKIEQGKIGLQEAIDIAIQIAGGLREAHEKDIVHRDIKPGNIMVTKRGDVKIMDFGLAKLRDATKVTRTGTTPGTLQYMSPEQVRGSDVDQRSDIFSFGVVLYEMITRRLPFKGDNEAALIHSILTDTPEPLARYKADVPEGLQRVVDKALRKDRTTRYQSVADIIADLKSLQKAPTISGVWGAQKRIITSRTIALVSITVLIAIAGYSLLSRLLAPSGIGPVTAGDKSIAVLPFKNMVPDSDNEWFSDGITEDIIIQLSKIRDLKVISRTSVMLYKDSRKSLREIGEELAVATILQGSVRRAGDRVRIVSQLVDARTDQSIWAETYDREMTDIFDIQADVAQKIALALKAKLSPQEKKRIEKKPTENLTAYDYYLKGREYYYRFRRQDNENAIRLFKKALEEDPGYALAYAGLGDAYGQRASTFGFASVWVDSAIEVSREALSIDPNCAEAYKALGLAYAVKGWLQKFLEATTKAVELNPNYFPAVANMAEANFRIGQYEEALKWARKALAINPTSAIPYFSLAYVYKALGEYTEARLWIDKALEIQPDFWPTYTLLIDMHLAQGMYDQAVAYSQRMLSIAPDEILALIYAGNTQLSLGNYAQAREYYEKAIEISSQGLLSLVDMYLAARLGYIHWKTGEQDSARKLFAQSLNLAQKRLELGDEHHEIPYNIAGVNAVQGNKTEAYLWLKKAIDAGWRDYRMGSIEPLFENLRDDEQFKQRMAEVRAMIEQVRRLLDRE